MIFIILIIFLTENRRVEVKTFQIYSDALITTLSL